MNFMVENSNDFSFFLPLQLDCKIWRDRSLGYLVIIAVIIKWNQVFVTTISPILFFKKKFLKTYFVLLIKKSEATVYYILARKFEIFFHNRAMLVHILLSITQWLKCNFVSLDLLLIKVSYLNKDPFIIAFSISFIYSWLIIYKPRSSES